VSPLFVIVIVDFFVLIIPAEMNKQRKKSRKELEAKKNFLHNFSSPLFRGEKKHYGSWKVF
jgi:hypothetical protein